MSVWWWLLWWSGVWLTHPLLRVCCGVLRLQETGLWTVSVGDEKNVTQTYKARVLVCADGAGSGLATKLGIVTTPPDGVCSRQFCEVCARGGSLCVCGCAVASPSFICLYVDVSSCSVVCDVCVCGASQGGTHKFAADGVVFYNKELLPGYAALFKHPNDEVNFCTYLIPGTGFSLSSCPVFVCACAVSECWRVMWWCVGRRQPEREERGLRQMARVFGEQRPCGEGGTSHSLSLSFSLRCGVSHFCLCYVSVWCVVRCWVLTTNGWRKCVWRVCVWAVCRCLTWTTVC